MIYFALGILFTISIAQAYAVHKLRGDYVRLFNSIVTVSKTADTVLEMWVEHKREHLG